MCLVCVGCQTEEFRDDRVPPRPGAVCWQKFIGQSPWDDRPLIGELARKSSAELGEPDGVLATRRGSRNKEKARSGCATMVRASGKIDNCQVGIYLGYVSRRAPGGHAAVLEQEWAKDKKRRKKCGVPAAIRLRGTRGSGDACGARESLAHGWIAGDDEMGRSSAFRRDLRSLGERYLLAVPSNTLVRDLVPSPEYCGRGRRPQIPYDRVDRWCAALPENAWMTIEVRDGARGRWRCRP